MMIIWGTFATVSSCNEMHSLCSAPLNISQNIIFNTVLFVKQLYLYPSLSIRKLTGWRGSGERLAGVSTWIQGKLVSNKLLLRRPNSWTKSRQKSLAFSSVLFKVTSTALPSDFYFFKLTQPLAVSVVRYCSL